MQDYGPSWPVPRHHRACTMRARWPNSSSPLILRVLAHRRQSGREPSAVHNAATGGDNPMNIKRGLFRLWLVCGLLFAAAIMFFSYERIATEFQKSNLLAEIPANDKALIPVTCKHARGALGVDYELDSNATVKDPEALCWYHIDNFRSNFPQYAERADEEVVTITYSDAGVPLYPAHPWRALFGAVGFAFGVPVFFLVIGSAFLWALSGFSRPKNTAL